MPIWLVPIISWVSHNLARFLGVIAIGVVLIGGPIVIYRGIYNVGYKAGYKQCGTDHPQIVQGDYYAGKREEFFIFKLWLLRLAI